MLAARFSGRWDESLEKDKDGNFFVDQPPHLFFPLIEFLQRCKNTSSVAGTARFPAYDVDFGGDGRRYGDFWHMAAYYGIEVPRW
jgi:hypothetical protein